MRVVLLDNNNISPSIVDDAPRFVNPVDRSNSFNRTSATSAETFWFVALDRPNNGAIKPKASPPNRPDEIEKLGEGAGRGLDVPLDELLLLDEARLLDELEPLLATVLVVEADVAAATEAVTAAAAISLTNSPVGS